MEEAKGIRQGGRHVGRPGPWWVRVWMACASAWREFLYLVMPAECAVCSRDDAALCPECAAALRKETAVPFRAEQSADALMSIFGQAHLAVIAAGDYRDTLAATILAFKNHGRTELGKPLARSLAAALAAVPALADRVGEPGLFIVPVPSTGAGWRRRGYDPVAMLLAVAQAEHRLPAGMAVARLLRVRVKLPWHRRHQKGLGRSARRANVRNTMAIKSSWRGKIVPRANLAGAAVVIVDDVVTTGSTLQEAVRTLENRGATVCAAVVLAAARAPEKSAASVPLEGREKRI